MSELYELPEGWEWKKLDDISKLIGGGTPKRNVDEYWKNGEIIWLSPTDLGKIGEILNISDSKDKITELGLNKSSAKLLPVGTVLYSSRATIGKIAINTVEVSTNQGFTNFICSGNLNNQYLAYILNRFTSEITSLSNSTTFKEVSKSNLKEFKIPLPPLQEQKRIVAKLDALFEKIDRAIALHQKNMDEADAFMGSVLNDVFEKFNNRKTIALNEITLKIGSGSTPRGGQKSYKSEGISLIRSMNVHDTGFREKGLAFIDEEQAQKLNNVAVKENDVLLNITGASVARCCIVDNNYLPARVNQHVSILRLKDSMIPSFLHYYIISPFVKSELLFNSSGGATREAITKSMLEKFKVPLLSLKIQQKTVNYLDKISLHVKRVKEVQKEKMEHLKALKASILDQAFRGQL